MRSIGSTRWLLFKLTKMIPITIKRVIEMVRNTTKQPGAYVLRNQNRDAKQKSGALSTAATTSATTTKVATMPRHMLTFHLPRGANCVRTPRTAASMPKTR